jgi:glycine cleavage system H protein
MSEALVFMMGEFEAHFPTDRQYAKNHMWAQQQDGRWRFGFAAYAVRLLQDVYFLDWDVDPDTTLEAGQEIGQIESSKAESALFAPIGGRLIELNQVLLSDPSAINVDKYGDGWLFEMEGDPNELMTSEDYLQHLEAVWEVTQKTIKGQLNQ